MSVIKITKENFQKEVVESQKPVLIDFYAVWCGPCKMVSPIIDEIADEHPEIKVGKIDIDEQGELAQEFGIVSIPTIIAIKGGKIIGQTVGFTAKEKILSMLG